MTNLERMLLDALAKMETDHREHTKEINIRMNALSVQVMHGTALVDTLSALVTSLAKDVTTLSEKLERLKK